MRTDRYVIGSRLPAHSRVNGQALVESLIVGAVLFILASLVVILAKYQSVHLAAVGAARTVAFECAMIPQRCADARAQKKLTAKARVQHFSNEPDSLKMLTAWTTRSGSALLEKTEDVAIGFLPGRFDAGRGQASNGPRSKVGSAVRVISDLAGPGRFDLEITGGLLSAQVRIDLLKSQGTSDPAKILTGMPLSPMSKNAILTDAWNASAPHGKAATTVESRVSKGQRLAPVIEKGLDAGYAPTKLFLRLMGRLSLEDKADKFRHREIDMDLIPSDRVGR